MMIAAAALILLGLGAAEVIYLRSARFQQRARAEIITRIEQATGLHVYYLVEDKQSNPCQPRLQQAKKKQVTINLVAITRNSDYSTVEKPYLEHPA